MPADRQRRIRGVLDQWSNRVNAQTVKTVVAGPVGDIEVAIDEPATPAIGVAVVSHPNPTQGGTMDNKVVQTITRAVLQMGFRSVRYNYRGVGASAGVWDEGRGEVEDALAVVATHRDPSLPLWLGGFSFGSFISAHVAQRLAEGAKPQRLMLVGPATSRDMPTVPADTIVIHGEIDEVVPLQATFDWARPQNLPVIVFPGVGHFFHGQLALLRRTLVQQLTPPAAS
jgi:alpha/beta superfamily hydrolase